jgi:purine-binding chemotaxis protein CheW
MKNESESKAYLTFMLGDEKFAIPVDHVQEVVELNHVTRIPNAPDYMLGIISLRGRVLPLLDTRLKLGLPAAERTSKNRILILDLKENDDKGLQIGAIVDVAREVVEIDNHDIQPASAMETHSSSTPIVGIVNNQGDITLIMDITKVFSVHDASAFSEALN